MCAVSSPARIACAVRLDCIHHLLPLIFFLVGLTLSPDMFQKALQCFLIWTRNTYDFLGKYLVCQLNTRPQKAVVQSVSDSLAWRQTILSQLSMLLCLKMPASCSAMLPCLKPAYAACQCLATGRQRPKLATVVFLLANTNLKCCSA